MHNEKNEDDDKLISRNFHFYTAKLDSERRLEKLFRYTYIDIQYFK